MALSVRTFRALVLGSVFVGVFGSLLDLMLPGLVPSGIQDRLDQVLAGYSIFRVLAVAAIGIVAVVLSIASIIGLCVFTSWARPMAIASSIISLALYPLVGPMVFSGYAAACFYMSAALWGAALALAYWSPIADRFQR